MALYMAATGMTGVKSITYDEALNGYPAKAAIECIGHSLAVGSSVDVDLGYSTDFSRVITNGIVKSITPSVPEFSYKIDVFDRLVLAGDAFIAPDNPETPYQANNVEASVLVGNLLSNFAGLTNYSGDVTSFTFGTPDPVDIKFQSALDVIENICRITGFILFTSGSLIRFADRRPYLLGSDTPTYSLTTSGSSNILRLSRTQSDEKLRNRVVVYGKQSVRSTSSGSSPYVAAGFYKTAVISHELITTQAQADATAALNLTYLNRLTDTLDITIVGRPSARSRDIFQVTEAFTLQTNEPWFCFGTKHTIGESGYETQLTGVK